LRSRGTSRCSSRVDRYRSQRPSFPFSGHSRCRSSCSSVRSSSARSWAFCSRCTPAGSPPVSPLASRRASDRQSSARSSAPSWHRSTRSSPSGSSLPRRWARERGPREPDVSGGATERATVATRQEVGAGSGAPRGASRTHRRSSRPTSSRSRRRETLHASAEPFLGVIPDPFLVEVDEVLGRSCSVLAWAAPTDRLSPVRRTRPPEFDRSGQRRFSGRGR
jgi:hypothetical protein